MEHTKQEMEAYLAIMNKATEMHKQITKESLKLHTKQMHDIVAEYNKIMDSSLAQHLEAIRKATEIKEI